MVAFPLRWRPLFSDDLTSMIRPLMMGNCSVSTLKACRPEVKVFVHAMQFLFPTHSSNSSNVKNRVDQLGEVTSAAAREMLLLIKSPMDDLAQSSSTAVNSCSSFRLEKQRPAHNQPHPLGSELRLFVHLWGQVWTDHVFPKAFSRRSTSSTL